MPNNNNNNCPQLHLLLLLLLLLLLFPSSFSPSPHHITTIATGDPCLAQFHQNVPVGLRRETSTFTSRDFSAAHSNHRIAGL